NNTLPVYRGPNGTTVNAPQRQTQGSTGRPAPTTSPNAPRNSQPTFSAPPVRSSPSPAPSGGGGGGSSSGPRRR
ncbi:MAG: hypothetical protein ACK5XN_13035, partial [Bacteroidota bacterium]